MRVRVICVSVLVCLPISARAQWRTTRVQVSEGPKSASSAEPIERVFWPLARENDSSALPGLPVLRVPQTKTWEAPAKIAEDQPIRPRGHSWWRNTDYPDSLRLSQTDNSWFRAMRHPVIAIPSATIVGLTAIQIIKTDRCVSENKPACNLIFGKNRTANYAVNIPLVGTAIWAAGRLKKRGEGISAILTLGAALMLEAPLAYTANPHVLTCQAGRTPRCQ